MVSDLSVARSQEAKWRLKYVIHSPGNHHDPNQDQLESSNAEKLPKNLLI